MSRNTTTTTRRKGRHAAFGSGLALVLGTLFVGSLTTYAAATASAGSQFVVLDQSVPSGAQAGATTTTTAPPSAQVVDAPSDSAGPGSSVQQTIGLTVLPGPLTATPADETVTLSQISPFGRAEPDFEGVVSTITVDDARGSLVGWRATVTLQSVSGLSAVQVAGARLCVAPHPSTMVAGNPADVVGAAGRSCGRAGQPVPVFAASPGGGGGVYSDSAGAVLVVPGGVLPGSVTATVAVAVS